jgi:hypothetical protein
MVRRSAFMPRMHFSGLGFLLPGLLMIAPAPLVLAQTTKTQQSAMLEQPPSSQSLILTCPDLAPFYPGTATNWQVMHQQLSALMPRCLQSSEYFALLGAALLNIGSRSDHADLVWRLCGAAPA